MSLKVKLRERLASNLDVEHIMVRDGVQNGEDGRYVRVDGETVWIEIFIANNRRVQDEHAIEIIESYLARMNTNNKGETK